MSQDAHYKMSKKIAQLTKVIFHLHTQNQEHDEVEKAIKKGYEKELENIVKEANQIIQKQRDALSNQKSSADFNTKIKGIEDKHEADKRLTHKIFEEYKSQVLFLFIYF